MHSEAHAVRVGSRWAVERHMCQSHDKSCLGTALLSVWEVSNVLCSVFSVKSVPV
jgi:hypothetical protein